MVWMWLGEKAVRERDEGEWDAKGVKRRIPEMAGRRVMLALDCGIP